ncbi:unnamed protein product [Ranitomeya imitator]|uniref:Helix-turn-helix domain-containing protein n=1 Tax=Ranitomeya imitator TaxID=111125 RepID=A0ABN9KRZ1_9NEOB|nr:unnamed protein product [Ranitomeya imitator]
MVERKKDLFQHNHPDSIITGSVPQDWRIANVVPIFKKGTKTELGNYRPVSLTSTVGKILEGILRDAILEYLKRNNLMTQYQHGFTRDRSCQTNLISFYEEASKGANHLVQYVRAPGERVPTTRERSRPRRVHYLQRSGVAMGAKCAPAYANTFLGWWEDTIVYSSPLFVAHVHAWYRFIDDVFMIWKGTKEECITFFDILNSNPYNIFLTYSISNSDITFLDLRVFPYEQHLATNLFRKSTATNALLEFSSFHPWHTKVGVPTGQFLRVRRNCTLGYDFSVQARELSDRFRHRGYPRRVISTAYQRARGQDQKSLLSSKRQCQESQTRFITDFNSNWKQCHLFHGALHVKRDLHNKNKYINLEQIKSPRREDPAREGSQSTRDGNQAEKKDEIMDIHCGFLISKERSLVPLIKVMNMDSTPIGVEPHIHYCNEQYHVTAHYRKKLPLPKTVGHAGTTSGAPGAEPSVLTMNGTLRITIWSTFSVSPFTTDMHFFNKQ